jgi:biopolymer transport protein ExbD
MIEGIHEEGEVYDEINVVPMLDLAYVLLVIFIILTTVTVQGIQVDVPKASAETSLAEPRTKSITVTEHGLIFLDTHPVTLKELESLLKLHKSEDPDLPVILRADGTNPYQRVVNILDLLGKLEINQLGLVTQTIK